jgi:glycosyltransferase involved in cell wall biosynthesis
VGRVLIIAYHFPPCTGTSGLLRAQKFSRYLPEFGWQPTVLTVHPRAYEAVDPRTLASVPADLPVLRTFALDSKRHLGFRGHHQDWMALPDRWASWLLSAVPSGLRAIRKHRIDIIVSTFPICTAVLAGWLLNRLTGKPWVVDLRDSMTEEDYPPEPFRRRVWRWVERRAMERAWRVVFTAASSRRMYLTRYPGLKPEKCLLISNGYDEEDFAAVSVSDPAPLTKGPVRLLHTGMLYPKERDPRPFFRALMRLKTEGRITAANLRVFFRAPSSEDLYRNLLDEYGIADLVEIQPRVSYSESLQECADADGLLLFQAANCNHQIPAKAYEYLRLRRPVLALTTEMGDTAALLNEVGGATIMDIADENAIHHGLPPFLEAVCAAKHPLPDEKKIQRYARRNQASELARCLDEIVREIPNPSPEKAEGFAR